MLSNHSGTLPYETFCFIILLSSIFACFFYFYTEDLKKILDFIEIF